MDGIVTSLTMH